MSEDTADSPTPSDTAQEYRVREIMEQVMGNRGRYNAFIKAAHAPDDVAELNTLILEAAIALTEQEAKQGRTAAKTAPNDLVPAMIAALAAQQSAAKPPVTRGRG